MKLFVDVFTKRDELGSRNPEWSYRRFMKTKLNRIGKFGAVFSVAMFVWLMLVVTAADRIAPQASVESSQIVLPPGVTGAQIQRALESLPAAGGEVVLPAGKIFITRPIVLRHDHQTLRGAGADTVLFLADGANCPVIILGHPTDHPLKTVSHLRVSELAIDGNRYNQQRETWRISGEGSEIRNNGITIQSVSDSRVENVTSAHCRSGGVVTTLGVQRLAVKNLNAFDNEFDGLACYLTTDSTFTDLYLHDNPGAGISLDLAFNRNVISNAFLLANDLGIFMRASRENKFLNVSIRNSHHYGVFMAHAEQRTASGWGPSPRSECVQNDFAGLAASNCGSAAFRVNNSTCTNNVLINAQFAKNLKGGLSLAQPDLVTLR